MTKILSRKPVFEAELFTVYEDKIELSNGRLVTYHSSIRKNAVSVFPLDGDKLYLIDEYRYLFNKRLIEAVAGIVKEKEELIDAAKRELKEETGIEAKKWKQIGNSDAAGSIITWSQSLFIAQELSFAKSQPEDSEDIRVITMTLNEAVEKIFTGEIKTAATIAGIFLINKLSERGEL